MNKIFFVLGNLLFSFALVPAAAHFEVTPRLDHAYIDLPICEAGKVVQNRIIHTTRLSIQVNSNCLYTYDGIFSLVDRSRKVRPKRIQPAHAQIFYNMIVQNKTPQDKLKTICIAEDLEYPSPDQNEGISAHTLTVNDDEKSK